MLFVEGETEAKCVPPLLRKWLSRFCAQSVGVSVVKFRGWADYYANIANKVNLHLSATRSPGIMAGIGLIDLYGPTIYPSSVTESAARRTWIISEIETRVANPLFRQHVAIHETEAWLLSQPPIFPRDVARAFPRRVNKPETVNFDEPPGKLLERLYGAKLNKNYKKVINGVELFSKLDIDTARDKCSSLRAFLDEARVLAQC